MKEILKHLVETTTLPEDSYLDQDAEILEIFVEEIEEIFVELDPLFEKWYAEPTRFVLRILFVQVLPDVE